MSNVVITGAAGFIGSHVTEQLQADGHKILAIDNLSNGKREFLSPDTELWEIDLGEIALDAFSERMADFDPEYAVHLAAIHFIPYCMQHPDETFSSNVTATHNLLTALQQAPNIKRIVAASTMDVYAPQDEVFSETNEPSPRNIYGLSKLLTEEITKYATNTTENLSAVCLRFSNVYGPRETNPHLIPDALDRIINPTADTIRMGNLGGERDFIHVSDISQAVCDCLFANTGKWDVFNLGTGITTPVRRVVELLRDAAGDKREITEDTSKFRKFDRKTLTPDISKIRASIGWKPSIEIEEGIRDLVAQTIG